MQNLPERYAALVAKRPELAVTTKLSGTLYHDGDDQGWCFTERFKGPWNEDAKAIITVKFLEMLPTGCALVPSLDSWCVADIEHDNELRFSRGMFNSPIEALLTFHEGSKQ